ncbi:MAG: Cys-tRNA(Pro) deacylase [Acholeplasmatales bacterium]|nr:Cys-tRNA(Pro) deacylase [Acholeplasmatales bacterium]
MEKTNVMRILDQKKIKYDVKEYPHLDGVCVEGFEVAKLLNQNPERVFKTLVTVDNTKHYHVMVVPVYAELDLKKCAKASNVKSLEMIAVKELLPLTGYVRGGCSPIGMKKVFHTIVDETAKEFQTIFFSAGKIGLQIEMNPIDLGKVIKIEFADLKKEA